MIDTPSQRKVLKITGSDRVNFLQGLITNDVTRAADALIYAALLTPQGKYLTDFFVFTQDDAIYLDTATAQAPGLLQKLNMYRLRADVVIEATDIPVSRGTGNPPKDALTDPRHAALGWRLYGEKLDDGGIDWDAIRVRHCIPEAGIELISNETFILEAGFERLGGVDFKKGCYVGQEVTARMKHKTELKKGLARVSVKGSAPVGTPITADGKPAGTLFTQSGETGIAYLRFGRAVGDMQAADAAVAYSQPNQAAN